MKLFSNVFMPIIVVGFNLALGVYTGLALFYFMAAVIAALFVAKIIRGFPRT